MRLHRRLEIQRKKAEKPDENLDDPADLKAIKDAQEKLGDFKLKSSKDYKVPVNKQVNAQKKLGEMILLQESIYNIKNTFNSRLVKLRDDKLEVIDYIQRKNTRIREINEALGEPQQSLGLWEPEYSEEDFPVIERQFTDDDRKTFRKSLQSSHTSAFLNIKVPQLNSTRVDKDIDCLEYKNMNTDNTSTAKNLPSDLNIDLFWLASVRKSAEDLSLVEVDEIKEANALLKYERSSILSDIETKVASFDQSLYELRKQRFQISSETKFCEMRLTILLKEMKLLRSLEAKDNDLLTKLQVCRENKAKVNIFSVEAL